MGLSGWRVTQPCGSGIQLQQGFSSRLTVAFFFFFFNLKIVLGSCIRQVVLCTRKWPLTFNSCSDFLFLLGIYIVSAGPLVLCSAKPVMPFSSVQFSSVAQSCPTLCDPMNHSTPGLPVHHQLPEFTQTHVHWVSDTIQPSHSPSPKTHFLIADV